MRSPRGPLSSTSVGKPVISESSLCFPFPVGISFAQLSFFELAHACPGDGFDKHDRIRQLPLRKILSQKFPQFASRDL